MSKEPWGAIPFSWPKRLNGNPLKIAVFLSGLEKDGFAWPKIQTLQKLSGLCRTNVYDAIAELCEAGMIKRGTNEEGQHGYWVNRDHPQNADNGNPQNTDESNPHSTDTPSLYTRQDSTTLSSKRVKGSNLSRKSWDTAKEARKTKTQALAKKLAYHTQCDFNLYLGGSQISAWHRLQKLFPFEEIEAAIDEAMTPKYKAMLSKTYNITATSIEFFMKSVRKPTNDASALHRQESQDILDKALSNVQSNAVRDCEVAGGDYEQE